VIHIIYNSVFHEKQEQILTKNGLEKIYVWLIIMGIGDYNKGRKKKKEVLNKTSLLKAAKRFRIWRKR